MSLAKTRAKKTKARKSKFQQLWEKAERLKKSNQKLDVELNSLLRRVEGEVMPQELAMGALIKTMLEKQLAFAEKRSLTRWQRAELDDWIHENLEEIDCMGLVDEDLRNAMANKHAREHDIDLDDNSDLSPAEQLDQYYEAISPADARAAEGMQDDPFATDDDDSAFADAMMDELFGNRNAPDGASATPHERAQHDLFEDMFEQFADSQANTASANPKQSIDSTVFKRLFRQTATALHPDKEQDEKRREEKHTLMSTLLDARKNNDLITVLQLHQQFVDADHSLSNADQHDLEAVLLNYLAQQVERKADIINQSPLHAGVYKRFYARSQKSINKKIAQHLQSLQQRSDSYHYFSSEIRTLKALKEVLAERYEQNRYSSFADQFFDGRDIPW